MKKLILIDRDGTLIHDEKYFLGRQKDWKKKIKILPHVVNGIKRLNKEGAGIYLITNQSGVAIKEFKELTHRRAEEVCKEVLRRLKLRGAYLNGYFICPHVAPSYVKRQKQYTFHKKYVGKCDCIKPALGMVFSALKKEGIDIEDTKVYVIGDRLADVETGINAGGTGILIPFKKEAGEEEKLKLKYGKSKNIIIVKNMVEAAKIVNLYK